MVADERSNRFIDTFVEQWLDIDAMNRVEVDTKVYPAFSRSKRIDHLRELIRREPVEFFGEILRQNLSGENFIRSDFVMLNDALARHYRFDGVHGGAAVCAAAAGDGAAAGAAGRRRRERAAGLLNAAWPHTQCRTW